jgi:hypothetical protein
MPECVEAMSLKHVPGAVFKIVDEDVEDFKSGFFWCRNGRHGFTSIGRKSAAHIYSIR